MNQQIQKIHEEILKFLLKYREDNPGFTFGLRQQNNDNRLKKGYWFLGDDSYVAVPFWTGRDWKNRTPNIFFKVETNGSSYLEFSFLDSQDKLLLCNRIKDNLKDVVRYGRGYQKDYETTDYIKSLMWFLENEKQIIDELVTFFNKYAPHEEKNYNKIDFFNEVEFVSMLDRVEKYRSGEIDRSLELKEGIRSIKIKLPTPKTNVKIDDIPPNARWIFLTGENGIGKTTILKAITATILGGKIQGNAAGEYIYTLIPSNSSATIDVVDSDGKVKVMNYSDGDSTSINIPFSGFSAYGPIRSGKYNPEYEDDKLNERIGIARSMFFDDAYMHNWDMELLTRAFMKTKGIESNESLSERMIYQILEVVPSLIPDLVKIEIPLKASIEDIWTDTLYVLEDSEGKRFEGVNFEGLSSGHRSIINFVGDMLIRLALNQKNISELSEIKGVVIIDEIDIHLHPKYQRALVEALSDKLPEVQFIVSTHSPIPILGAPKESVIYRVKRTVEEGVISERVDDKVMFSRILPNAMLNSPIFGLEDLVPRSKDPNESIILEDNYNEAAFYERLENQINDFMTNEKEKELLKLFKSNS